MFKIGDVILVNSMFYAVCHYFCTVNHVRENGWVKFEFQVKYGLIQTNSNGWPLY
jgi:hypothetical protein